MIKYIFILLVLASSSINCSKKTPKENPQDTAMEPDTMVIDTVLIPMVDISEIGQFPDVINECSGLIKIGDKIISMNDGSSHTLLQEINPTTAEVLNTINVNNIKNIDWEALQYDGENIYIADIGNNEGDRENLSLYTVPYQQGSELTCIDTINFIWPDQTNFTTTNFHPFDCESLLIENNTAIFFSKNRSDLKSNVYRLDLDTEVITKGETINIGGLSTDVAKDPSGDLVLLSYITINGTLFFNKLNILELVNQEYVLREQITIPQTTQIEAIVHVEDHKYLLGAESESSEGGYLYSLDLGEYFD